MSKCRMRNKPGKKYLKRIREERQRQIRSSTLDPIEKETETRITSMFVFESGDRIPLVINGVRGDEEVTTTIESLSPDECFRIMDRFD